MEYLKKRKKFIDFDGVIKDTYHPLFEDYFERRANGEYVDDTLHVIRKDWIYVYAELAHSDVHLKLSQPCKSTVPQYKMFFVFKKDTQTMKIFRLNHINC